jgi:acyl-CoA synthetase (AMP-forming)/AMP-acid ligase II
MSAEHREGIPQCTLEDFETRFADRHLVHGVAAKWARERGDAPALVNADRKQPVSWAEFERTTTALAMQLLRMGFRKGDFFATSLPLLTEHIFLEYACFKIGVVFAPLDLRLAPAEVIRSLGALHAKAFAFLGQTQVADFRELGRAVEKHCGFVEHMIQFSPPADVIEGAVSAYQVAEEARAVAAGAPPELFAAYRAATAAVHENDGALVIFTTGSTGAPKPALLAHRNIACETMCISEALFGGDAGTVTLVNLPPSHVGCQTELLMGTLFGGGTAVLLETFDAARSLKAIQDYKVKKLGQIPAMFNFEWRLRDYDKYDLSSLDFVAYGGSQISRAFADKLATMAPRVATGLGLTECAGFCTYLVKDVAHAAEIFSSLGFDMPVYPVSIRQPMRDDGNAGDELPDGELGQVCFRGPQTFLGYVNDAEATAKTVSRDGVLYTGDMGFKDAKGLHLTGRTKWVIKPFGYQVFPGDVENHICTLEEKVEACGVVGVEHAMISEAIVAFVEKKPGAELTAQELERHARALASYMRPRHYVVLEPGQLPLNRVVKTDYVRLSQMAREEVERLRAAGAWDRGRGGE